MRRITACLIFFLFCVFNAVGQTYIIVNTALTGDLTSCIDSVEFKVDVQNPSPYNLSNFQLAVKLPTGINYIPGSATNGVTDFDLSASDSVILTLPDLNMNSDTTFSIWLTAGCMTNHSSLKNKLYFTFNGDNTTGGLITASQTFDSGLYNVKYPDLTILNMTNQSYTGVIGDVFQRCITITNGGNGALSAFTIKHEHGSGLTILSNSIGVKTEIAGETDYLISGTDFTSFGNGDTLLDPGESVTLCEEIKITACQNSKESNYIYSWGCGNEVCKSKSETANIVFVNESPNLNVTKHDGFAVGGDGLGNYCYGENNAGDFPSWIVITNDGVGTAYDNYFQIGQNYGGYSGLYSTNYWSSFAPGSFTIEKNGNVVQSFTPDSLYKSGARYCFSAPINAFSFTLDSIQPGDTIVIRWSHLTCVPTTCTNGSYNYFTWRLEGQYRNKCGDITIVPLTRKGPTYPSINNQLAVNQSPGTIIDNNPHTATFTTNPQSRLQIPNNANGRKFKYRIIFPDDCITINPGSIAIENSAGTSSITNYTSQTSGDTMDINLTNHYPGTHWNISFDVQRNCASCAGGNQEIKLESFFKPDSSCAQWFPLGCSKMDIDVICGDSCDKIALVNSTFNRVSVGLADNNDDGVPDVGGVIDPSLVRLDRLMYNDTAELVNTIYVHNDSNLNYQNLVVEHEIENVGPQMQYATGSAKVHFYEASTGTYFDCILSTVPTITTTGSTQNWEYNIPISSIPCLSAGYQLQTGDSIVLSFLYISKHSSSSIVSATVNSKAFGTIIPYYSPNFPESEKYYCIDHISRQFSLVGYYFTNAANNVPKVVKNCDEFWMSQNYYFSVGPCCSNYAGGNMFPYEYRHFTQPDSFKITIPNNFTFEAAEFNFRRTTGTGSTSTTPMYNMTPSTTSGSIYTFDVTNFFGDYGSGATIPYSDDGYYGTIKVKLKPNCSVVDSLLKKMKYAWYFGTTPQLASSPISPSMTVTQDPILYNAPRLSLQSNLLTVNSQNGQEQWVLTVGNSSPVSDADNFWIAAPGANSTITGDSLLDMSTNNMIYPNVNGMFDVGDSIAKGSARKFIIYTTATSCDKDSINVYAGWDCSPVPDSLSGAQCTPMRVMLTINPLVPAIQTEVTQTGGANAELCDTLTFKIKARNYYLGYAFDLISDAQLPYGLAYAQASSSLIFNGDTISIADPTISGQSLQWDLSTEAILADGIAGLDGTANQLDNYVVIVFKVIPECGFSSGSSLFANTKYASYCGSLDSSENNFSPPINLNNMNPDYSTEIHLGIDYIIPCGTGNNLVVSVLNNGPGSFTSADSIRITLPAGLTYVPGSFSDMHNANGIQTNPSITVVGGLTKLTWGLNNMVSANDSMTFKINLQADAYNIPCDILEIRGETSALLSAVCSVDNNVCESGVITGQNTKSLFVYKTDFLVTAASGTLTMDENGQESTSGSFTLFNQGATLGANSPLVISYYNDLDYNGVYSPSDQLIKNDTFNVLINADSSHVFTFDSLNTPNACNLIAVLSLANNPCFCSAINFVLPLTLESTNFYDTICSLDQISIGNPDMYGYNYAWETNPDLTDTTIAQPTFSHENSLSTPETIELYRTIIRGGCNMNDTSFITVKPLPMATLVGDTIICQNESAPSLIFTGTNGTAPYMFTYTDPTGASQTVNSDSTGVGTITAPTNTVGTFDYTLDSVQYTSSPTCTNPQTGSVTIKVDPLPTATISGDTTLCQYETAPTITFIGANGVAPYTFTYTTPAGATQTILSDSSGVATITVPTSVFGTFTYTLDSVSDNASPNSCTQNQSGTVTVTVNKLPTITAGADVVVCYGDSVTLNASGAISYVWSGGVIDGVPFVINDTTMYTVVGTDANGCKNKDSLWVDVVPTPKIDIQVLDSADCTPLQTQIENYSTGNLKTCMWTLSNGEVFYGCDNLNISLSSVGCYDVQLQVVTSEGCSNLDNFQNLFCVYPKPTASFYTHPDSLTNTSSIATMFNESQGATSYQWNFGDGSAINHGIHPSHEYPTENSATYPIELIASNDYGCTDTAYQAIPMTIKLLFFVPNAFTPDDRPGNQIFKPIMTAGFNPSKYALMIYNRWGELIFESHDVNNGWDGTYKGKLAPDGVYVWKINVQETEYETMKNFVGHLSLLR